VQAPELVGPHRVGGDGDPIDPRAHGRLGPALAEQLAVRLEPDPGISGHRGARGRDEPFEAPVEQRLADAIEDERFQVRERGHETCKRLVAHVALDEAMPGRLLHALRAAQVAARRDRDEELRGERPAVRRQRRLEADGHVADTGTHGAHPAGATAATVVTR
jgi:hypothetical protein